MLINGHKCARSREIVQYYVASPMLINGHKCARSHEITRDRTRSTSIDLKLRATAGTRVVARGRFSLRLYSLITCARPLRVYLYEEGFALFASDHYDETSDAR